MHHLLRVSPLCLAFALPGQSLVKDINPVAGSQSLSSGPNNGAEILGVTYFAASDDAHGRELWRTDGTLAGTTLVADINPGPASSNPSRPVWINGSDVFLFTADDGGHGVELWASDGTGPTTTLVADINPGSASSTPLHLTPIVSITYARFYFSADDGTHGRELWLSNTTTAGTLMAADLQGGNSGSMSTTSEIWDDPNGQNAYGYFTANNGVVGEELWKIAANGATLVQDIFPGGGSSNPKLIMSTSPRGSLLFAATHPLDGREPYHVINGVSGRAADLNPGPGSSNPVSAVPAPGSSTTPTFLVNGETSSGNELYRIAIGSPATLVKNINPGAASSNPVLWAESGYASRVLIAATTANEGRELWASDGTTAGTVLLRDIYPGTASSNPSDFVNVQNGANDYVLFAANDGVVGEELWITNKFTAFTQLLEDCAPGAVSSAPSAFVVDDSTNAPFALFSVQSATIGSEPWISNATAAGTLLLKDVRGPVVSSTPRELTTLGTTAVACFAAGEPTFGTELWKTNATTAGTTLVKDIKPGSDGSGPQGLMSALGKLFFRADDGVSGTEPWVSDGTTAGTFLLADLTVGTGSSVPHTFTLFGSYVYFGATDQVDGFEVWRTDGTTAGTTRVTDLVPGAQGSNPNNLVVSNGKLFFAATTTAHGTELWSTDGTAAGTALVEDINPGVASAGPAGVLVPFAWNSLVLFGADSGSGDLDLWRSDGTAAGTFMIGDFDGTNGPSEFVAAGSVVGFAATTNNLRIGRELWKTSGTAATTVLVKDLVAGSSDPVGLTLGGAGILFAADTFAYGRELWTSDFTEAGTVLLKDINPGRANGLVFPDSVTSGRRFAMTRVNGQPLVYFAATDLAYGIELWRTDGTTAGTVRLGDVNPGGAGSRPSPLTRCGSSLLLSADGGTIGIELYRIPAPASWYQYGLACRGGLGNFPQIGANGAPEVGNASFAITVTDGRANTTGAMLVGFGALALPFGGGCTLLVDLFGPSLSLPLATNARGDGSVRFPIPPNINLQGLVAFAQAALVDLGGSYGGIIAISDGLQMLVQR